VNQEHAARMARRESTARAELLAACDGTPATPELNDEQLHDNARVLVDRARLVYEQWKRCGHAPIPQLLSVSLMRFRSACEAATAVIPQEDAHVES